MTNSAMQMSLEQSPELLAANMVKLTKVTVQLAGLLYETSYYISYANALIALYANLEPTHVDELERYRDSIAQKATALFTKSQELQVM